MISKGCERIDLDRSVLFPDVTNHSAAGYLFFHLTYVLFYFVLFLFVFCRFVPMCSTVCMFCGCFFLVP